MQDHHFEEKCLDDLWVSECRPCPACNSKEFRTVGMRGGDAHRAGKGLKSQIVECARCSLLYAYPTLIPAENPYDRYTAAEYFERADSEKKLAEGDFLASFAERLLGRTGKLLDLGCGRGELSLGAMKRGWDVYSVEMGGAFADVAREKGLRVEQSNIQDCMSLNKNYDVVLLSAVFEHLYDPVGVLDRIYDSLNFGGLLFLSVPNEKSLSSIIGNMYMKLIKRNTVVNLSPTFPPFHVIGFSKKSLKYILENNGFSIHMMKTRKVRNDMPESKNIVQRIERMSLTVFQYIGAVLGMGDEIVCWAIKKS